MNLLAETKYLAKKYDLLPDTGRGQNFLISEAVLKQIVQAAELKPEDRVVEIGSGLGTLTVALAAGVKTVVSIESDRRLFPLLDTLAKQHNNIRFLYGDITKTNFQDIIRSLGLTSKAPYKVVANIPYYLTGKIIEQIYSRPQLPELMILLVQKEVAEKFIAQPGQMSKQSLAVQFYSQAKTVSKVPAGAFWPAPEVDSAIVRFDQIRPWSYAADEKRVWQLVRIGFSSKRKKLANNLASGLQINKSEAEKMLKKAGLEINVRAQELSKENWIKLTSYFNKIVSPPSHSFNGR